MQFSSKFLDLIIKDLIYPELVIISLITSDTLPKTTFSQVLCHLLLSLVTASIQVKVYLQMMVYQCQELNCLPCLTLQGGRPSPFDRNMGTKMAAKCVEILVEQVQAAKQPDGN